MPNRLHGKEGDSLDIAIHVLPLQSTLERRRASFAHALYVAVCEQWRRGVSGSFRMLEFIGKAHVCHIWRQVGCSLLVQMQHFQFRYP